MTKANLVLLLIFLLFLVIITLAFFMEPVPPSDEILGIDRFWERYVPFMLINLTAMAAAYCVMAVVVKALKYVFDYLEDLLNFNFGVEITLNEWFNLKIFHLLAFGDIAVQFSNYIYRCRFIEMCDNSPNISLFRTFLGFITIVYFSRLAVKLGKPQDNASP